MESVVQAQIASRGSVVHSNCEVCRVIGSKKDRYLAVAFQIDQVDFVGIASPHPTRDDILFCSNVIHISSESDAMAFAQRNGFH